MPLTSETEYCEAIARLKAWRRQYWKRVLTPIPKAPTRPAQRKRSDPTVLVTHQRYIRYNEEHQ